MPRRSLPMLPMPKRSLTAAEKLGHVWGAVFLAAVAVLAVTLFGKALIGG